MTILLVVLHVIVCLILIVVILLQVGKGHGLSGASLGTGNVQSIFGMKTGNFLSKATTVAAITFVLTTIALDVFQAQRGRSLFQVPSRGPEGKIDVEKMKEALEKIKQEAQRQESKARSSAEVSKQQAAQEQAVKSQAAKPAAAKTETTKTSQCHSGLRAGIQGSGLPPRNPGDSRG